MLLIVAIALLLLLPWPWSFVAFVGCLTGFVVEVLLWNRTVRGRRERVGAQTLIGQTATVVSRCAPDGQVRVSGEIWAARCREGADEGEAVTVVGRDGLVLAVERAEREAALEG